MRRYDTYSATRGDATIHTIALRYTPKRHQGRSYRLNFIALFAMLSINEKSICQIGDQPYPPPNKGAISEQGADGEKGASYQGASGSIPPFRRELEPLLALGCWALRWGLQCLEMSSSRAHLG